MLFNSLVFGIFLPTVFFIYWYLDRKYSLRVQNFFILVVSYIFYGWWDWRFLVLILFSSVIDFTSALRIEQSDDPRKRRFWMGLSLVTNLGMLGFFKYFNFFIDSAADLLQLMGFQPNLWSLRIILPVGISFYTFQALSYTIDVFRRELKATHSIVDFLAFVSFFPQLVAGPIERAAALLPQFYVRRTFELDKARDGMRQMLWGFAKKMVIADNLAPHVQAIYADFDKLDSVSLFIGTFLFALQVYCDFSGYSDIAIGSARLFGFRLMRNFAFPLFSRDMGEFWRRWHISLSTWFRDSLVSG
jgi:alginate O-acetyltransferase complex protein AlgI